MTPTLMGGCPRRGSLIADLLRHVLTEGGRVTQVGEGREAAEAVPSVMTLGEPAVGDVMADRYQLDEHVNDDSAGRRSGAART